MRSIFVTLIAVVVGCSDDPVSPCPRGAEGCMCDSNDRCDGRLVCDVGTCVIGGDCGRSLSDGDPCSDGDLCTEGDVCDGVDCVGASYSCADGVACTDDICDGAGGCVVAISAGFCWIDDECYGDGGAGDVACLVCDVNTSQSTWSADNAATCDDGDPCTHSDVCNGAACAGSGYGCDDGNHCTVNVCNGDGTCSFVEVPQSCVIDSTCYPAGMIEPGNPCARCDPSVNAGDWTALLDDSSCDDDEPCTADDLCTGGDCVGTPYVCDDSKDCTVDTCNGDGSCSAVTEIGWCLIDDACYLDGAANGGDACTVCDAAATQSGWTQLGADDPCDDGMSCTQDDVCDAGGSCAGTSYVCDDSNDCTTDTCDGDGGCGVINLTGPLCSDGDDCTQDDDCDDGVCGGVSYVCDDSVDCTADLCDGDGACLHPTSPGFCLIDDACYGNTDANPANSCQWCEPTTSQVAWSDNDAGSCSDNDACTDDDTCSGGTCSGTPLIDDPYEDNNDSASAYDLGSVDDDASYPAGTFQALLYGVGDIDFYRYRDVDASNLSQPAPRVQLSTISAGADFRLCAYFSCDNAGSGYGVSCTSGTASILTGASGCCSDNAGSAAENVQLSPDCDNGFPSDDSGEVLVRVDHISGIWSCTSQHTITWGDD